MKTRAAPKPLPAPDDFAVDSELVTLIEAALAISRAATTGGDPVYLCLSRRDLDVLRLVVAEFVEGVPT